MRRCTNVARERYIKKGARPNGRAPRGNEPVLTPMYAERSRRPPPSRLFLNLLLFLVHLPLASPRASVSGLFTVAVGAFCITISERCQALNEIAVFPALTVKAQWTDTAPDGLEPQVAERPRVCSPGSCSSVRHWTPRGSSVGGAAGGERITVERRAHRASALSRCRLAWQSLNLLVWRKVGLKSSALRLRCSSRGC